PGLRLRSQSSSPGDAAVSPSVEPALSRRRREPQRTAARTRAPPPRVCRCWIRSNRPALRLGHPVPAGRRRHAPYAAADLQPDRLALGEIWARTLVRELRCDLGIQDTITNRFVGFVRFVRLEKPHSS